MIKPAFSAIPPAPQVLARLLDEYRRLPTGFAVSFSQFLHVRGYNNFAAAEPMMDSGAQWHADAHGLRLIPTPDIAITGTVRTIVLLVDFPDYAGEMPPAHYRDMLFSKNAVVPRSLRDYYAEVSRGQVDMTGEVHGWLRLPNPMGYYANNDSGRSWDAYPNNAPRMAEDAVNAALAAGVHFGQELDLLGGRVVTGLIVIHAGPGAESVDPSISGGYIWSHKWGLRETITVGANLEAATYLTVPEAVPVGTTAHELGHLVFQWDDFYDPNYDADGDSWDGSGAWDLMAGGAHNGGGRTPAHPAALHKIQHGWVPVRDVRTSTSRLTLPPVSDPAGEVARIVGPRYQPGQYLLLESRKRTGFDRELPGEGLLVWRIDERKDMTGPSDPGMMLLQADGRHSLSTIYDENTGDRGDPFPGSSERTALGEIGTVSTTYPSGDLSGVRIANIAWDPMTGIATMDVEIEGDAGPAPTGPGTVSRRATPNRAIPDADPDGIESVLTLSGRGAIVRLSVEVTIEHAFFEDLRIDLVAPSGLVVRLVDRTAVPKRDGTVFFSSATHAELKRLSGAQGAGDWRLRVFDLVPYDKGTLRFWALTLELRDVGEVHLEGQPALEIPDNDPVGASTTLRMDRGGIVQSLGVGLDLDHDYPGDLLIELLSPEGHRAVLHNRAGTAPSDLQTRYESWQNACLAPLVGAAASGDWTLRVSDRERQDRGVLNGWSLDLRLEASADLAAHEVAAAAAIGTEGDPEYVGAVRVDAVGTGQAPTLSLDLDLPPEAQMAAELVAPGGQRAFVTLTGEPRPAGLPYEIAPTTHPALDALRGLPVNGPWVLRLRMRSDTQTARLTGWRLRLPYVGAGPAR